MRRAAGLSAAVAVRVGVMFGCGCGPNSELIVRCNIHTDSRMRLAPSAVRLRPHPLSLSPSLVTVVRGREQHAPSVGDSRKVAGAPASCGACSRLGVVARVAGGGGRPRTACAPRQAPVVRKQASGIIVAAGHQRRGMREPAGVYMAGRARELRAPPGQVGDGLPTPRAYAAGRDARLRCVRTEEGVQTISGDRSSSSWDGAAKGRRGRRRRAAFVDR